MSIFDESTTAEIDPEKIRRELIEQLPSTGQRAFEQLALAALGSIPWVGGVISAAATVKFDAASVHRDSLQARWLEAHQKKIEQLQGILEDIAQRISNFGEEVDERIRSEQYLDVVRKAFRAWDRADTDEKRKYIGNLVANAAGTRLTSDDVLRLFVDWLDLYHEAYLTVVREVYLHPKSTRYQVWRAIYGDIPRENSAEADLYKLLIRDLSTGGVIRQERETNSAGQFMRQQQTPRSTTPRSGTLESAFENTKRYELTELGNQFVHYTMNEVVTRLEPGE